MSWNGGDITPYSKVMKACMKLTRALSKLDQDNTEFTSLMNFIKAPYDEDRAKSELKTHSGSWSDLTDDIRSAFTDFGAHLEALFDPFDSGAESRTQEYYTYRDIGRRFWGHANDFWNQTNTKPGNLDNNKCLELLTKTFALLPGRGAPDNLTPLGILEILIRQHWEVVHKTSLDEKELTGLINRILSVHRDSAAVQFLSLKETIEKQLDMIQWQDYVPANGRWMKTDKLALDHLKEWRKEQEAVLQVTGDGGLGKTKLIYEFLKSCLGNKDETESFDTYIFLTAKSEHQGEFNVDYRTRTEDILVTNPRDPTVAVGQYIPNLSFDQCIEYYKAVFGVKDQNDLKACFKDQKVLVILDNFEDVKVPDIEKHLSFMKKGLDVSMKSKFLITGRADADDAKDYGIGALKLAKLTRDQASELVRKRYRYLFEKQYADTQLNVPAKMDLREAFSSLTKRDSLIETIAEQIVGDMTVRAFKLGQHHPMVLFWVISLLMDPKIFEEAENLLLGGASEGTEVNIEEKNAVTMFKFVVEHEQYGLQTFVDNWETWIRAKSTVYLENDSNCMLIIHYLAENKTELIYDFHIYEHLEGAHQIVEEDARRALTKILAQPDILEQDTDYPQYRITKKALATLNLDSGETPDDFTKKFADYANEFLTLQTNSEPIHAERIQDFLQDVKDLRQNPIELKKQAIAIFKAVTFSLNAISDNGDFPAYVEDAQKEVKEIFILLKNLFIPNPEKKGTKAWWKVDDMKLFIEALTQEEYKGESNQEDVLKHALEVINNPRKYPTLRDNKNSDYYIGNLPDAYSHLLWIETSREDLLASLKKDGKWLFYFGKSETTPFLQNVIPNVWRLLGSNASNYATEQEIVTLYPLFFRSTHYLDQLHMGNFSFVQWYLQSILHLGDMNLIVDLMERIKLVFSNFQPVDGAIIESFTRVLKNEQIRDKTKVEKISVGLYNYFGSLPHHPKSTSSQPFESLSKLPFTRWNNDFGLPHHFDFGGSVYLDEEGITIDFSDAKRDAAFILSSYIQSLEKYTFLQLHDLPLASKESTAADSLVPTNQISERDARLEELRRKSDLSREKLNAHASRIDDYAKIPVSQGQNQPEVEESMKQNLIDYFDNQKFTRIYLRDVLKDNKIPESEWHDSDFWREIFKHTEKDWKSLYSAHDKDTIVSFDRYVPKNIPTPKLSSSAPSKDDPYLAWFERNKHGMHHDKDKAIEVIEPIAEKLIMSHLPEHEPPVLFANAFVQTFTNPYSKRNQLSTSMRWYAAFHYAFAHGTKNSVCDIIDCYMRELNRQLPVGELTRDVAKNWEKRNKEWINDLKDHFGCEKIIDQPKKNHKRQRQGRSQKERLKSPPSNPFFDEKRLRKLTLEDEKRAKLREEERRKHQAIVRAQKMKKLEADMEIINPHMRTILEAIETNLANNHKEVLKKSPGIDKIYFSLFQPTGNLEGTWYKFITGCDRYLKALNSTDNADCSAVALRCVKSVLSQLGASQEQISAWESEWQ